MAVGRTEGKSKSAKGSANCRARQLLQKDCHIDLDPFHIHVWNDKILLNSRVDRRTKPLPVKGDIDSQVIEWQFVRGSKLGGRRLLETGLWTPPKGEAEVETLIWTVYEVTASDLIKQLERPIQKRKKVSPAKINNDKMIPHELKLKANRVYWSVGRETGEF